MRVFLHLLLTVNHEDKKWQGTLIKRGSKITSYANLAEETGLSVRSIRTAINKLKSTSEVTSQSTNRFTVVTVQKYEEYQAKRQATRHPSDKQTTTTKEDKEIKNIYSDKEFLKNMSDEDIESIRNGTTATKQQVISKGEELYNWVTYTGKESKYKDFKLVIRNAIKKDYPAKEVKKVASWMDAYKSYDTVVQGL